MLSLSISNNNLKGSFPIYYSSFIPHLKVIDLGHNSITGPFPTITATPDLVVSMFSGNPFCGFASFNAGAIFVNLKVFKFDYTQPWGNNGGALLAMMPYLCVLNITGQNFDGPLFPQLAFLTSLEYCGWGHNEAVGPIPPQWGALTNLRSLDLSSLTNVNGTIPSEFGLMTQLSHLDLQDTPVSGDVPRELCVGVEEGVLDLHVNCSLVRCCASE